MSDGLFNPEAFEQMPGQMSMAQVESSFEARWYRWIPDHGSPSGLLAADDREAQLEAAELWEGQPGTLHRTDSWYRCERLPDGFVRALDAWQPPCGRSSCAEQGCCASRDDCPCGIGDER